MNTNEEEKVMTQIQILKFNKSFCSFVLQILQPTKFTKMDASAPTNSADEYLRNLMRDSELLQRHLTNESIRLEFIILNFMLRNGYQSIRDIPLETFKTIIIENNGVDFLMFKFMDIGSFAYNENLTYQQNIDYLIELLREQ